ncbi:outer membrane receptor protein involved in Fe transport [Xanthomonas arboricola]|nr:outer membrane receptor protein involved in Fe transport [Xanthomonas sp. 3058]
MPSAIVERVEVLKDGASSIYGSDAIAGVVNIITRSDFDGAEVNAYVDQYGQGDGQRGSFDTVGATRERGNLVIGLSSVKEDAAYPGRPTRSCATSADHNGLPQEVVVFCQR